jgi:hypothetical protein
MIIKTKDLDKKPAALPGPKSASEAHKAHEFVDLSRDSPAPKASSKQVAFVDATDPLSRACDISCLLHGTGGFLQLRSSGSGLKL